MDHMGHMDQNVYAMDKNLGCPFPYQVPYQVPPHGLHPNQLHHHGPQYRLTINLTFQKVGNATFGVI